MSNPSANMAALYGVYHGPEGLKKIAMRVHNMATATGACVCVCVYVCICMHTSIHVCMCERILSMIQGRRYSVSPYYVAPYNAHTRYHPHAMPLLPSLLVFFLFSHIRNLHSHSLQTPTFLYLSLPLMQLTLCQRLDIRSARVRQTLSTSCVTSHKCNSTN